MKPDQVNVEDEVHECIIESIEAKQDLKPVKILSYFMGENNLTKAELALELNVSRLLITEILNYKRNNRKR
jgi:antitoxin component HigA of HigAB toxin-antitoxin module